jgi:hypothetical protein
LLRDPSIRARSSAVVPCVVYEYCLYDANQLCQPKITIDVARCFVLRANRSLVVILHNNGLRHSALSYTSLNKRADPWPLSPYTFSCLAK